MKHIRTKQEFYDLSRRLLLGNRLQQWDWPTFDRLFHDGTKLPKKIGVRGSNVTRSPATRLYSPWQAHALGHTHKDPATLLFDEGAPNHYLTLQGELMPDPRHLYLRCSREQIHARKLWELDTETPRLDLLRRREPLVQHIFGLEALCFLKMYMDVPSWEMLSQILHDYSFPVVEFSCFDHSVGVLRWNTLFWEVRTTY